MKGLVNVCILLPIIICKKLYFFASENSAGILYHYYFQFSAAAELRRTWVALILTEAIFAGEAGYF